MEGGGVGGWRRIAVVSVVIGDVFAVWAPVVRYYAYVLEIKEPPNVRQAIGIAVHEAIEHNMQQKVASRFDLPEPEVLDAYSDAFDRVGAEVDPTDPKDDKAKDSGLQLVQLHHRSVAPRIQPVWVEEPVAFSLEYADEEHDELVVVPYTGTIDLVDDKQRVRDWKTAARTPNRNYYSNQQVGYALAYRQRTGNTESEVVLDFLIRTKKPSYLPLASGGPISDEEKLRFARAVANVYKAINAGTFLPNGAWSNPPVCSWCGYRDRCPDAVNIE